MKHSSSSTQFGGIAVDTNTLAGQWMTFSHMANHYRKLLNVKPRVNTGLVQGNNGIHNHYSTSSAAVTQSSRKKMGSSKKRQTYSSNISNNNDHFRVYEEEKRRNSLLFSSHPEHLNTSLGKSSFIDITSKPTLKSSGKHSTTSFQLEQPQYSDYQVVFGPSSIRSSTDAFLSDETESTMSNDNKPPSEVQAPIGVTEKIRRFLSHIHQLDLTTSSTSSVKNKARAKAVTTPTSLTSIAKHGVTAGTKKKASSVAQTIPSTVSTNKRDIDYRLSRHSKCFLPSESPLGSPRKSPKLPSKSSARTSGGKSLSSSASNLNRNHVKNKSVMDFQYHSNCDQLSFQTSGLRRNRHTGSEMEIHSMVPEKDGSSGKKPGKSRRRAGSIASIGTICGSDELTTEDMPMSIKDICSTLEGAILGEDDLNDQLLSRIIDDNSYLRKPSKSSSNDHHHYHDLSYSHRTSSTGSNFLNKSSSTTSLVQVGSGGRSSNKVKTNGKGGVGSGNIAQANGNNNNNNKDSSRDSAYGFSSGESRITTRESTPEKKCLNGMIDKPHKHSKHRDIDMPQKPCKDLHDKKRDASSSSEKHHSSSNSKVLKEHRHPRSSRKDDNSPSAKMNSSHHTLHRDDSSETYITLLAELTQDIVSKGIYTNKGLKTLFKSYADQNKNLNKDKLEEMLEHLRMDLGIPKDDSLDRMDFGYGSVTNASSTAFFYRPPPPAQERLSMESIMASGISSSAAATHQPSGHHSHPGPPLESLLSDSPSPTTIIPTTIPEAVTPAPTTTTGFSSSGGPNTSSNRSTTTTEEGSVDVASDNDNYKHYHEGDDEEDDMGVGNEDDELSLSESEVTQALRFAGLDDCTMEELKGILNS